MTHQSKPLLGILLILSSGVLLASHDGMSKFLAGIYPVVFVVWARYLAQSVLMLALFTPQMGRRMFRTRRPLLQLVRGLSLVSISLLFITALRYIPLGEATAVIFLAPLVVIVLSATVLKEKINPGLWVSVLCGLAGVLIIVRPGGALFTPAILLPLGGAVCFGLYQLLTRRLSVTDHPVTSNFLSSLVGTLILSALVPFFWTLPSPRDALLMLMLGGFATCGHMLLTHAFRFASAATLAPFTYGQIVFACLIGFGVFGHAPDALGLFGIGIIIVSGLCMAWTGRRAADQLPL